jgi:hypothetical protein
MNMHTPNDNAHKRNLEQVVQQMETLIKEKEQREQAEEVEANRLTEEAEKARNQLISENADEKEALGAQILEKISLLKRDKHIRSTRKCEEFDYEENVVVYQREITDKAEILPDMPKDRNVQELFQLTPRGTLTYIQIYEATGFSGGMLQTIRRRDPLRFGFRLASPTDFRKLSISSVKAFLEALKSGEPYRISAERIARLNDDFKTRLGAE